MNENKNNDIKFEDLVDNYTYQQNGQNQSGDNGQNNGNQGDNNGQGNGFTPPPYGNNPFWSQPQPQEPKSNGYNIASLVLGILSIVCCCLYGVVSLICGILSIVFFVISKKNGNANGLAVAGLICAIFGLVLGLIFGLYTLINLDMILDIVEGSTLEL